MGTRATRHCGRNGYARHNDRDFNIEEAEHIQTDKTGENVYLHYYNKSNPELTFMQAEMKFYEERYGEALNAQNKRYEKSRHRERIKTIEDLYKGKGTQPVETILQIGNKDNKGAGITKQLLIKIYNAYNKKVNEWNKSHGNHLHRLSVAVHMDEQTPHLHERCVWDIQTEDGFKLAQDKALEQAGVPLPDPAKPKGRHNNRKMSIDAMFRGFWLEACQEHGIEVETEPLPDRRHKTKEDYIDEQIAIKNKVLYDAIARVEEYNQQAENAYQRLLEVLKDERYNDDIRQVIMILKERYPKIWQQLTIDLDNWAVEYEDLDHEPSESLQKLNERVSMLEPWDDDPGMDEFYPINPNDEHDER